MAPVTIRAKKVTVLDAYFISSRNSADRSAIDVPSPAIVPTLKKGWRRFGGRNASTSATNLKRGSFIGDEDCCTSVRRNVVVQLICPGGLPTLVLADSEVEEIVDLGEEAADGKKNRKSYEVSRKCQDAWAIEHPWSEMIRGDRDTIVHCVKCVVCSFVKGRSITMGPKSDTLIKHAGKRVAKKNLPHIGVKKDESYIALGCRHLKALAIYNSQSLSGPTILEKVQKEFKGEKARKIAQFGTVFHLLKHGRPMVEYEALRDLFLFLKMPNPSKKHWSDNSGWLIADHLYKQVVMKNKELLAAANYLAFTCDEVTTIDNQSWISIHGYVVVDFYRVPILVSLERVTEGGSVAKLSICIVDAIGNHGGVSKIDLLQKFLSFGADGAAVFQGSRAGVTRLLQDTISPHMEGVHCVSHRTQLAIKELGELPVIVKIESLMSQLNGYFGSSPKRHLEFTKFAAVLHTKGLKLLKQVKTRWLSMLSPLVRVISEYRTLVAKLAEDSKDVEATRKQRASACALLALLLDVSIPVALSCFLPLLQTVNSLVKFGQQRDIFICDYLGAVKVCQGQLYSLYSDPKTSFSSDAFMEFKQLLDCKHGSTSLVWVPDCLDLNESGLSDQLSYVCGEKIYPATYLNSHGRDASVTREVFNILVKDIKELCTIAAESLVKDLSNRFPAATLMDALGVVYPQYWLQPKCEELFEAHFSVIKAHYCQQRHVDSIVSEPILLEYKLNHECSAFKGALKANAADAMQKPILLNPLTRLWRTLSTSNVLKKHFGEWFKVAEIAAVQVLGSVEDERTFSTVSFTKNKLRNRLTEHLAPVVGIFSQTHFTLETFPFDKVYDEWRADKKRQQE